MLGRRICWWSRVLGVLLFLLASETMGRGEEKSVVLSGESRSTAIRLTEARKLLDEKKWPEAIEALQTILHASGHDLVSLTPTHSIQARRLCQIQLATMPAEALRLYRQRYETPARKKLQQAQAERDVAQLRAVVEEAFCTRAAEKAIDLLGDLAFERGRFVEAQEWWRLLSPLPDSRRDPQRRGLSLAFPDPQQEPARLQAKQLLARLFEGSDNEWDVALERYRQQHSKAEGTLAGRKGLYAETLQALYRDKQKERDPERLDWPTFGGDPSRGRVIPATEDIVDQLGALCREGPTWTFNLEDRTRQDDPSPAPAISAAQARTLAFYPVFAGRQVLLADAQRVTAYDLHSGESRVWYDVAQHNGGVRPNLKLPAPPDLRYTLTVAQEKVFARLGAQDIGVEAPPAAPPRVGRPPREPRRDNETFLVRLGTEAKGQAGHFRWHIRGIAQDRSFFEGAPLVAGGLIWIASTRYTGDRCFWAIDCYPDDDSSQPPLRWRREVCETRAQKTGEPRYRHHLLTLAGTQLVYCTHSGAIAALDAFSGRTNWAIRYPQRAPDPDQIELHDLAPVLFAAGSLFVAPADSDRLLCLDPATGRLLWERESIHVVHLLGVGQGKLIFTTTRGLHAVSIDDGSIVWNVPWTGSLTPGGRGLLLGDIVLFPTTQKQNDVSPSLETVVYAIRQQDGRPACDPVWLHRLPAGNLAYANGCLAVADRQNLYLFVPPRFRLEQRKSAARLHPESTSALLELARAEADAELWEKALHTLEQAEANTRDLSPSRRRNVVAKVRRERQGLLLEVAGRAAKAEQWQETEAALRQAEEVALAPRERLHARLRAAHIWQVAGQSDRALAVWETIAADKSLGQLPVIDKRGRPTVAAKSAAEAIARLHGEKLPDPPAMSARAVSHSSAGPALPLLRTWHTSLGSHEFLLAEWRQGDTDAILIGSTEGQCTCRESATGEVRWQCRLPFSPVWAGHDASVFVIAGETEVAGLRREDGTLLWRFTAVEPGSSLRDEVRIAQVARHSRELQGFQLAGGRLFFLQNQRRLFVLDAASGAILWDRWAPDGELSLPVPWGCFCVHYHAGVERVLIQMSGRRFLLDAATGRLIHEAKDSPALWQRPPLPLDERTLCVISDNRHFVLLDSRSGRSIWTHSLPGGTTSSGEAPSLVGQGDLLLCIHPVNIGYYLQRLDRNTGKPAWPQPQLLTARKIDTRTWAFDAEVVYCLEDDSLVARSLEVGGVLWRQSLPGYAAWRACRLGDYLAVYPVLDGDEAVLRFRTPFGSVQWEMTSLLMPDALIPVWYCEPKTGRVVQRLNFRNETPVRSAVVKRNSSAEGRWSLHLRTSSLLAGKEGPVYRLASPQPFVAVGREIWGLQTAAGAEH